MKMKDKLILSGFISSLFYSTAYPVIHTVVINNLDSRLMSFSSLVSCVLVIIINKMWLSQSEKLYKRFSFMLLLECLLYFILLVSILTGNIKPQIYYVIDTLLFASVTRSIICGGNRLKAIRYKDSKREEFDNKSVIFYNIASIAGYSVSSIFKISVNVAFVIMYIGIVSDNTIYYMVYRKMSKEY